jgi:hypothetical protein
VLLPHCGCCCCCGATLRGCQLGLCCLHLLARRSQLQALPMVVVCIGERLLVPLCQLQQGGLRVLQQQGRGRGQDRGR